MSAVSGSTGQIRERPVVPGRQPADDQPMPGVGWFFRTPFYRDWLFWLGVVFAVSSLVGEGSYLTLAFSLLLPYWVVGALVSRHRRQGRPPVQRLRIRGWGLEAWCAAFTAFALGFGAYLVVESLVFYLRFHELF